MKGVFFRAATELGMATADYRPSGRERHAMASHQRPLRLSDELRVRGGRKSRRRVARTWVPA